MDFNLFAILGLMVAAIGIMAIRDIIRFRKTIFDENFTDEDRMHVTKAAFFVLLPLSVALHELGHAVAVWALGGRVVGFGYFFFAG